MLKPPWRLFFLSFALSACAAFFELMSFGSLLPVLYGLFGGTSVAALGENHWFHTLFDWLLPIGRRELMGLCALILVAVSFKLLCQYVGFVLTQVASSRVLAGLRIQVFERLVYEDQSYLDPKPVGRLSTLLNQTTSQASAVLGVIAGGLRNICMGGAYLFFLFFLSWKLAVLSFLFLGITVLVNRFFLAKILHRSKQSTQDDLDRGAYTGDIFSNSKLVKSFNLEPRLLQEFRSKEKITQQNRDSVAFLSGGIHPVQEWVSTLCLGGFLMLFVYSQPMSSLSANVAPLLMTLLVWKRAAGVVMSFVSLFSRLANLLPAILEILAVVQRPKRSSVGKHRLSCLQKGIQFREVSLSYGQRKVLRQVSFFLPAGKKMLIVGKTGAGKTSLVELVLGFYRAQEGKVCLEDRDISQFDIESLRRGIGLVSQQTLVLHDTVYNNIALGDPKATRSQVEEAARRAKVHESIMNMDQGYQTVVGDKGSKLSAGEIQRLAIARLFLKKPHILILDEATSHLDSKTAEQLQGEFAELMEGRTAFIISHQPRTVYNVDVVLRLSEGRVTELQESSVRAPLEVSAKINTYNKISQVQRGHSHAHREKSV